MNSLKSLARSKFVRNLSVMGLVIIAVTMLVSPVGSQNAGRSPESVIEEDLQTKGMKVNADSPEYKILMQDILLGEHPDLVALAGDKEMTEYAIKQLGLEADLNTEIKTAEIGSEPLKKRVPVEINHNRQATAQYALNWSQDGGKKRNSSYPDFSNDCTNFASQAIYAGGIPMQGAGSCRDEDNPDKWYVNRSDWWCIGNMRDWAWSYSWSVVYPFKQYMASKGYANAWLYPRTLAGINQLVRDGWDGDIIQLRVDGTSYHTMIVTSWYWYSETNSDLRMTYHTGPGGNDVREKSIRTIINGLPSNVEVILVSMN